MTLDETLVLIHQTDKELAEAARKLAEHKAKLKEIRKEKGKR